MEPQRGAIRADVPLCTHTRAGIIADWNVLMAACTAGNAVPLTLGAGSASKATAMYSIKVSPHCPGGLSTRF